MITRPQNCASTKTTVVALWILKVVSGTLLDLNSLNALQQYQRYVSQPASNFVGNLSNLFLDASIELRPQNSVESEILLHVRMI